MYSSGDIKPLIRNMFLFFELQLIECPSVYEMMASEDFPWAEPPELRLWRKQSSGEDRENTKTESVLERYGPKVYLEVMSAALRGNTVCSLFLSRMSIVCISCRNLFLHSDHRLGIGSSCVIRSLNKSALFNFY